tara:strand:- start:4348 stop:5397 length:1050 start_codon:yes stop_codon:yes gene_type:complete
MKNKTHTFTETINQTLIEQMNKNNNIVCFGLGINDPKRIFGTTNNLNEKFGSDRVFDTPTSENAMTGIGIGMSLNGARPIMMHQRMDFFLLAMDQLINNAAKWKYMFGGKETIPIVIRLIVGRGWGQGPTHSQNFQNLFANIPGLRVYIPSLPSTARYLLIDAIKSPEPVIFIEHRWLHNIKEEYDIKKIHKPNAVNKIKNGNDITIISSSYSTIEIIKIYKELEKNNISYDHLDINIIKPLMIDKIYKSVRKTGKLLILDNSSHKVCSIGSEIISELISLKKDIFKKEPIYLALPDIPSPTSFYLTKNYYNTSKKILKSVGLLLNKNIKFKNDQILHDIPDPTFKGPF